MKHTKIVSERGLSLYLGGMRNNTLSVDYCLTLKNKKGKQKKKKKHPLELESHLESEKCNRKFEVILWIIIF